MDGFYRWIQIIFFYKPNKLTNHIIVKSNGGFTASTDFSVGHEEFITTSNIHKNAPRLSVWLWAQFGVFLWILNEAVFYLSHYFNSAWAIIDIFHLNFLITNSMLRKIGRWSSPWFSALLALKNPARTWPNRLHLYYFRGRHGYRLRASGGNRHSAKPCGQFGQKRRASPAWLLTVLQRRVRQVKQQGRHHQCGKPESRSQSMVDVVAVVQRF